MTSNARALLVCAAACVLFAAPVSAQESEGFNTSRLTARYGATFAEPGIDEDVPKNIFTFENIAAGRWWSSYLFVDVLRSWSDADANAKEVYGEWYPSVSLRALAGKARSTAFVRDVSATIGLNTGVRSTGPSPFAILPGVTVDLNVPGFAFLSVGAYAYIDRGRFQGQFTECAETTWQITPSWSVPFRLGKARLQTDGFVDFLGKHATCEGWILATPRLMMDLSSLWDKPGHVYIGADFSYWRNKYGIAGLEDKLVLPLLMWVM